MGGNKKAEKKERVPTKPGKTNYVNRQSNRDYLKQLDDIGNINPKKGKG